MCGFQSILLALPQSKKELLLFPLQADALSNTYESMCQQQEHSRVMVEEEDGAEGGATGPYQGRPQGHANNERTPCPHIFKPQVGKTLCLGGIHPLGGVSRGRRFVWN